MRRRCPGLKHVTEAADCLLLSLLSEGALLCEGRGGIAKEAWKKRGGGRGALRRADSDSFELKRGSEEQDNGDSDRQW